MPIDVLDSDVIATKGEQLAFRCREKEFLKKTRAHNRVYNPSPAHINIRVTIVFG